MGKRAFAIAVTQRPDARNIGAQLIVHLDIAGFIGFHAGFVQSQVAGVRHASDCKQQVGSDYLPARIGTVQADSDAVAFLMRGHAFRVQAEQDAFSFEDLLYCLGNIFILARDEARAFLNDGDVGSKAAVHLAELQADVAAADNNQMFRQKIHPHHGRVGKIGHLIQAGHRRHERSSARVDENLIGL